MNLSVLIGVQISLIVLYCCPVSKTQRLGGTTTDIPGSIESQESIKKSTKPTNKANVLKEAAVTKLKEETCQVKKSEKALKLQVNECESSSPASGKGGRKPRRLKVDEETKQTILSLYGGMFYTQQAAIELENSRQKAKGGPKNRVGRSTDQDHDGNICCPR